MQTQHLIIITVGLLIGLLLMGYFIRKAVLKAFARLEVDHARAQAEGRQRIEALNQDIIRLNGIREAQGIELQAYHEKALFLRATPFTMTDHQTLMDIAQMLRLAHDTWHAMPGTETTQVKAIALLKHARALAYRTFSNVSAATALNGEPLDTQLIEWLNSRGDLWGDLEQSTIAFPHQADTQGYSHLRDALREAYEHDKQRQVQELGAGSAEDAA
jgi:hypothetical protein